jgi:hypothetical protein
MSAVQPVLGLGCICVLLHLWWETGSRFGDDVEKGAEEKMRVRRRNKKGSR